MRKENLNPRKVGIDRRFLVLIFASALLLSPRLAWSQGDVIQSVWVHQVPRPPAGDFWDPVVLNIFSPRGVYPDIVVCVTSSLSPRTCRELCPDAQLQPGSTES